eukprot:89922-Prymnesium_polylepis.1
MASGAVGYPASFAQEQRLIAAAARQYPLCDPLAGFGQHHSHHAAHAVSCITHHERGDNSRALCEGCITPVIPYSIYTSSSTI